MAGAGNRRPPSGKPLYKRTGTILVALVIVSVVGLVAFNMPATLGGAPDFEMAAYQGADQLGGEQVSFETVREMADGRPIVLNFWGGSCPPCRAEMPGFQRAFERNQDSFLMLGVDIGPYLGLGTQSTAEHLLDELSITYPAAFAVSSDPIRDYGITSLPSTFFFDGEGKIVDSVPGFMTESTFEGKLQAVLAGEG